MQLSNEKCLIASHASPTFYDVGPEHIGHFLFINLHFKKNMEPVIKRPRFSIEKTEDDLKRLLDMKESKNTKKATKSAVNIFRSYCNERQRPECFEKLSAEELVEILRFFYAEVTRKGGRTL